MKKADTTEKLLFYTYGLPGPFESEMATSAVAAKWGFGYKWVAGCLVDQKLMDSVNKHNDIVNAALIKKYGKDWEKRYEKDVATELAAYKRVIALLDKQKRNTNKRAELQKEGYDLRYDIAPTDTKNVYRVKAVGKGMLNGKEAMVCHYQYLVELNTSSVKLTSDTITKM